MNKHTDYLIHYTYIYRCSAQCTCYELVKIINKKAQLSLGKISYSLQQFLFCRSVAIHKSSKRRRSKSPKNHNTLN